MLETIVTAALTAAIIQLLPYAWRRVKRQPERKEVPSRRPPSPMLDRLRAQAEYVGSPAYILAKAKVDKSKFRVTQEDLEGVDSFLASDSGSNLTEQEVERLLSDYSDVTALSNVWSVPDKGYEDKLKALDELGRRNFGHMKGERAKYLSGNKSS